MQTLMTVIVTWLSLHFGLPAVHEHPRVAFASPAEMAEIRYSRLGSRRPDRAAAEAVRSVSAFSHDLQAIYDDRSRTIYLREGWTGATPAEVSVLVHELVHHVQNLAGLKYDCPEEREGPAYRAQARWLEFFGSSLADEFDIDPMTLLVRTRCMH